MDVTSQRIFCAEQINVPLDLPAVLKEYTKEVIRKSPASNEMDPTSAKLRLYQWSADYFRKKMEERAEGAAR